MSDVSSDSLPRGATLGRYVIADVLGQGGMGVVYSAFDTQLGRRLAIKFLRDDRLKTNPSLGARLLREAQAMARLTHPNVVSIYDVGTHEGRVFLAMEYVEGCTLATWLETKRPWRERLEVLLAAGEGLAAAHDAAVIHRDFKPDNVIIGRGNRVVVMDFGLAREADQETMSMAAVAVAKDLSGASVPPPSMPVPAMPAPDPLSGTPFSAALTLEGSVLGTIGFMAPEQAYGQPTSVVTDQFSYCVTVYLALYGRRPFAGDTIGAYLRSIFRTPPEESSGSEIPAWVRNVLLKGMNRKPENRYGSMRELLVALRKDPRARLRSWGVAAVSVVLLGALSVVGIRALDAHKRVCAVDPREWNGVWDEASKKDARRAFVTAEPSSGGETFDYAAKGLDAYVAKWSAMTEESCKATKLRKVQSDEVHQLRADCLGRRKVELASVARLLRDADREIVRRGVSLAYSLDPLTWCQDGEALRASAGLPDDPGKRTKVIDLRAKLADAKSESAAGKRTEALLLARDIVVEARSLDHVPTTAEALLFEGETRSGLGGYLEALPVLKEAYFLAYGAKADAVVVEAASSLTFAAGDKLQRAEEGRTWLEVARAGLKRLGGDEVLECKLMRAEANFISEVDWRPEQAIPIEENLVAIERRLFGVHPMTATALYNLGVGFSYLGEPSRAVGPIEESLAMYETVGGPRSTDVGVAAYMLGQSRAELGEFARGEELLYRALSILDGNGMDYWSALTSQALTWSLLAKGDNVAAVESGRRALGSLAKAKNPSVLIPIVNVPAAAALTRMGRAVEALPLCDRALQEQEKAKAIYAEKAYGWDSLRCKGEALIALGRPGEAVAYLERSLTLTRRMFPGDYARVQFALAKALTASHGDRTRATELAAAAKDEFSKSPFLSSEMAELEAWTRDPR